MLMLLLLLNFIFFYQRFVKVYSQKLPEVKEVSYRPRMPNEKEIGTWTYDQVSLNIQYFFYSIISILSINNVFFLLLYFFLKKS